MKDTHCALRSKCCFGKHSLLCRQLKAVVEYYSPKTLKHMLKIKHIFKFPWSLQDLSTHLKLNTFWHTLLTQKFWLHWDKCLWSTSSFRNFSVVSEICYPLWMCKLKPLPSSKENKNKKGVFLDTHLPFWCFFLAWMVQNVEKGKEKKNELRCISAVWSECLLVSGWVAIFGTAVLQIHNESEGEKRIWRHRFRHVPLKPEYWTYSAAKLIELPFVASDMEINKSWYFLLRSGEVFDHLGKNEVWFLDIFQNLSENGEAMFNCIMETREKFWHPTHQSNCFFISPLSWKDSNV